MTHVVSNALMIYPVQVGFLEQVVLIVQVGFLVQVVLIVQVGFLVQVVLVPVGCPVQLVSLVADSSVVDVY